MDECSVFSLYYIILLYIIFDTSLAWNDRQTHKACTSNKLRQPTQLTTQKLTSSSPKRATSKRYFGGGLWFLWMESRTWRASVFDSASTVCCSALFCWCPCAGPWSHQSHRTMIMVAFYPILLLLKSRVLLLISTYFCMGLLFLYLLLVSYSSNNIKNKYFVHAGPSRSRSRIFKKKGQWRAEMWCWNSNTTSSMDAWHRWALFCPTICLYGNWFELGCPNKQLLSTVGPLIWEDSPSFESSSIILSTEPLSISSRRRSCWPPHRCPWRTGRLRHLWTSIANHRWL